MALSNAARQRRYRAPQGTGRSAVLAGGDFAVGAPEPFGGGGWDRQPPAGGCSATVPPTARRPHPSRMRAPSLPTGPI